MSVEQIKVTTAGSAGSATGTGTSERPIKGVLWGIYFNFHVSAPATTDSTVAITLPDGTSLSLLVLSNTVTDAMKHPRIVECDNTGTALTTYSAPLIGGANITISLAQCDALTNALVATLFILD